MSKKKNSIDADELYTRSMLGIQILKTLQNRAYPQKQSAACLGIKQSEVSALMSARFGRFSQERLIGFLNKLNQKVTIEISRRHAGEPYQQVTFVP